jgi:hypothetical protein
VGVQLVAMHKPPASDRCRPDPPAREKPFDGPLTNPQILGGLADSEPGSVNVVIVFRQCGLHPFVNEPL